MAGSDTRVARGDVIYVMGEFEDVTVSPGIRGGDD